ncbi:MAG: hypothetical protein EAX96_01200 [Candidatus Lokiarchaeota archaeon]|nr:hypothetical protein [Candidatus Lokiarchaeota archaeon]
MQIQILEAINDAARNFQYDYIIIDGIFLIIWITILIFKKKKNPLLAGIITGILIYIIDAVFWWNLPAGPNYPAGTFVREYWIGGIQIPHPLGEYFWLKFGADFMMTISYAIFAFGWLWIVFENLTKQDDKNLIKKDLILFTSLYFGFWMLTPFISYWLPINDIIVNTVRHMDTQIIIWIINVLIGYITLIIIYASGKFGQRNLKIIGFVFIIGLAQSFFMEFPLFISGIRPTGIIFLIYEIFFLFNQGAPYLFILYDKILPILNTRIRKKMNN